MIKDYLRQSYLACLSVASRKIDLELARRSTLRGQGKWAWLTPEEATVAVALAKVIVPSDEETPGLDDIDVLGPPAIDILDKLVQKNQYKQEVYARGLLSFDIWAMEKSGCLFHAMAPSDQSLMLREAQRYGERLSTGPLPVKAWRKLCDLRSVAGGRSFAARLFPEIRSDCLQVFYTSKVSWVWLEYDGPPMDKGYPRLASRL
jgi:hypothetical protein